MSLKINSGVVRRRLPKSTWWEQLEVAALATAESGHSGKNGSISPILHKIDKIYTNKTKINTYISIYDQKY